ncbi:unnamed protein product [Peronospora destructor]|uniref:Uncharacterized protein n=1 Tax=Peronospora destructor TaxID=86335 RepID=A0AAV0VD54_9STRA|nr:unnamed protein product [Peronospora destructor]
MAELTREFPVILDAQSLPKYLRWNVNIIAMDNVDGAKMVVYVWSWAVNEPSTTEAEAYVLMNVEGRWVAKHRCRAGMLEWHRVSMVHRLVAENCPDGTAFAASTDPYQNYLLHEALVVKNITNTSLVINADLTPVGAPTPARSQSAVIRES